MYEAFGAIVDGSSVEFRLFFPDNTVDSAQYGRGGPPLIQDIRVVGDFQALNGVAAWDAAGALPMRRGPHPFGWLYTARLDGLPEGFYEYQYRVAFQNGEVRRCGDPCTKYDGAVSGRAGFAVGGNRIEGVRPIDRRLPLKDLVIYELMIDDFTAGYRGRRAPLDAVRDKLDHLHRLGINAVQFMPWTAWRGDGFSWGYDPVSFFAVEHRYYDDPSAPADKLYWLQRLVSELHARDLHVIMDGVFNHVNVGDNAEQGFPYYWLYQNPQDSPFIGKFGESAFFSDFDFDNECTSGFIADVCTHWLDRYQLDGIRFDYVRGFLISGTRQGIPELINQLNRWAAGRDLANVSFILELLTDDRYAAVDLTNRVGAAGCWYDPLMWQAFDAGRSGNVGTGLVRALNSGQGFADDRRPVVYVENHDHSTLTEQCGGRDEWWRTQPLAMALMTISGAPMIHNGQEFGEQYWFPEDGDGRVMARPLRWDRVDDEVGRTLLAHYAGLIAIRKEHPGLRSQNFYPQPYDERDRLFDAEGYGVNEDKDVAIFHRWGDDGRGGVDKLVVALNMSGYPQRVDIPVPDDGRWTDLIGRGTVEVRGNRLRDQELSSHWGRVYALERS